MEWKRTPKRQIQGHGTGKFIVEGIGVTQQLDQSGGHIRVHRHIELAIALRRDYKRAIARARRDQVSIDAQARFKPGDRQRARVRIVDVEADLKILLQEITALELDFRNCQYRFLEARRTGGKQQAGRQRTAAPPHKLALPWHHGDLHTLRKNGHGTG